MARQVERRIHALFADKAMGREWFNIDAATAAMPIPDLCEKANKALEAYRDNIISDDGRLAVAENAAAERRRQRVLFDRVRANIGMRKAQEYARLRGFDV